MKTFAITQKIFILLIVFTSHIDAQDQRAFNQNSSRSNHYLSNTGFNFSFSPVYSTSLNSKSDSLLFRGSGGGIKFGGDYFFGRAGIGLSSGFGTSSPDNNAINRFLQRTNIPMDQLMITKSNQQNMYLLVGPSLRFGNTVEMMLHAKGGLFVNNGGLLMVQQRGSTKTVYGNESTSKSIYAGFQTGLNIQYYTKSDIWSFGIGADYLGTKTEINNYDARRGGGIEGLKLSKNISDFVAGITIRYSIRTSREQGSGLATGRVLPTVNKKTITARDSQSGMATGRLLPTVNKKEIAIDESGVHRIAIDERGVNVNSMESCGPVTVKTTNADGSITEKTFSCPDDAADYAQKTNPQKQKQWLPANFKTASNNGSGTGIVSGRISWPSSSSLGIITNKNMKAGDETNPQTKTKAGNSFGTIVTISAREAGSGMATGKRAREMGSGMATGKLYETVFEEGQGDVCDSCLATIKSNPLYNGNADGKNPLYQENEKTIGGGDCDDGNDGIAGINVLLIDPATGTTIAKTKTEACGDFFFANVPQGDYIVKVNGVFTGKKGYDAYMSSKTDLLGSIQQGDDVVQLTINSDNNSKDETAVNNSYSNIKNLTVIEADLDGDGEFESLRVQGTFSDGTTRDITSAARTLPGKKSIVLNGDALNMRRRVEVLKSNRQAGISGKHLTSITVATGDVDGDGIANVKATAAFSDGYTQDVTNDLSVNTSHSNIKQYNIAVADLDGDGIADAIFKPKTKSNQSNDRIATGDTDDDGMNDLIWSPRSNVMLLRVASGDVDGDGIDEILVGNKISDFGMSRIGLKSYFETGDKPTQSQRMAGDPVHGVDVKLGFNGNEIKAASTNEEGEFEFKGLDAGNYSIQVEQNVVIDDETVVTVSNAATKNINTSESNIGHDNKVTVKGWNPETKENAKNINTSESNLKDIRNRDNSNNQKKAQNNNTVRSNRTDNAILVNDNNDDNNDPGDITIDEGGQPKSKGKKTNGDKTVGPVKWMAPESMQKAINSSHSGLKNELLSLDALEQQLDADQNNSKSIINTSRNNIKSQRLAINQLEQTLNNLQAMDRDAAINELEQKRNEADLQFLKLRSSLQKLGTPYNTISNDLKARHDIAMNAIRNLKG